MLCVCVDDMGVLMCECGNVSLCVLSVSLHVS
jgi:hypothetical protein